MSRDSINDEKIRKEIIYENKFRTKYGSNILISIKDLFCKLSIINI